MKELMKKTRSSLCNPVMFSVVMKDEELFRELLSRILPDRRIRNLRLCEQDEDSFVAESLLQTEKTVVINPYAKAVRFDVLFEEEDTWYNVEMQAIDTRVLPQRSRYYHAVAAIDSLHRGQAYNTLKPGYVIFLCLFDLFRQDKAVYSFEMYDKKNCLNLEDGQFTIFLNTACRKDDIPQKLKNLFIYLEENIVEESDPWICRLRDAVKTMEQEKEVRRKMTLYDEWLITESEIARMTQALETAENELQSIKEKYQQAEDELREAKTGRRQMEDELREAKEGRQQMEDELREARTGHRQMELEQRRLEQLSMHLLGQNRTEELKRALQDADYRKLLFEEYGI